MHFLPALILLYFFLVLEHSAFADTGRCVEFSADSTNKEIIIAQKLSQAIRYRTISSSNAAEFPSEEFLGLHSFLETGFPKVHQQLKREIINDYSLFFTWQGSNNDLKPILLSAHLDVVPVETASKGEWLHDPFGGVIQDGYIWGRGAMDDKYRVIAILQAVEELLEQGFRPARTIYLAFGHDEEIGGVAGAGNISQYLQKKQVELEAVFDEGLAVVQDAMSGLNEPIALVGTAAKGGLNLLLTVYGQGGHSSVPPKDTPISILSRAITNLQKKPFEAKLTPTTQEAVHTLADKLGGKYKFAVKHQKLFRKKILKMLAKDEATNALIRTQMAVTMISAGAKENVIPRVASAVVNFRILNGETDKTVMQHVRRVIDDERVEISVYGEYTPPTPVSPTDNWVYQSLKRSIGETFGDITVIPSLFPGSTDSKHYATLTNNIYLFAPQIVDRETAQLVHNVNERLSVEVLQKSVSFYSHLIQNMSSWVAMDAIVQEEVE